MLNLVIKLISSIRYFRDTGMYRSFHFRVFSKCPIVLIAHICPPYLLIEEVWCIFIINYLGLLLDFLLFHFLRFGDFLFCLFFYGFNLIFLLFLFIQLISTIEIGSVGPFAIKVEPKISYFNNFRIRNKILHIISSIWKRQFAYFIPINFDKILFAGEEQS